MDHSLPIEWQEDERGSEPLTPTSAAAAGTTEPAAAAAECCCSDDPAASSEGPGVGMPLGVSAAVVVMVDALEFEPAVESAAPSRVDASVSAIGSARWPPDDAPAAALAPLPPPESSRRLFHSMPADAAGATLAFESEWSRC